MSLSPQLLLSAEAPRRPSLSLGHGTPGLTVATRALASRPNRKLASTGSSCRTGPGPLLRAREAKCRCQA
eukprot:63776-Pyramimonas_sp.AAC.1